MRKSLLTGGPVSPRSPFFPFLPRLPGGPGGPTYREQREEEEEKKKKTQIITLSLIIYNFFFLVVFVYASLGRTINARITKSSQKRFESDTGCPHTGLHNWLQFCRIFVSAGYFSNEQMAGRSKKKTTRAYCSQRLNFVVIRATRNNFFLDFFSRCCVCRAIASRWDDSWRQNTDYT